MIQNIKSHIQFTIVIAMKAEPAMSKQNQKSSDVLLSDVVKTPSTDCAL